MPFSMPPQECTIEQKIERKEKLRFERGMTVQTLSWSALKVEGEWYLPSSEVTDWHQSPVKSASNANLLLDFYTIADDSRSESALKLSSVLIALADAKVVIQKLMPGARVFVSVERDSDATLDAVPLVAISPQFHGDANEAKLIYKELFSLSHSWDMEIQSMITFALEYV